MRTKKILIILVIFVGSLMLMPGVFAANSPPGWRAMVYLSNTLDSQTDQDPENSGYGLLQVTVWEHWNGNDWDIYMKYSPNDGAAGSWVFPVPPATHPAITSMDEINPAVSVTRDHPDLGQEIHVVYQRFNPTSLLWEVCHTYTNNFGVTWLPAGGPTVLNTMAGVNAIDPAISYAEDITFGGGAVGMLNQIVWAEETGPGTGDYQIQYDAWYYDPTLPARGLIGSTIIRANPNGPGFDCMKPEIASIDDTSAANAPYVYYFAIVWEEEYPTQPGQPNQWHVWYIDGVSQTSPLMGTTPNWAGIGQVNPPGNQCDALEPDIAATQDYQTPETYFHHITYEFKMWTPQSPQFNSIESHCCCGAVQQPGIAGYARTAIVRGPVIIQLERPTIASKLVQLNPTIFESWVCWEDWNTPAQAPDIYFRRGTYTVGAPPFAWAAAPGIVGYPVVNRPGAEHNPEVWNRNDALRLFPPLTHIVFDDTNPTGQPEVYYIDP